VLATRRSTTGRGYDQLPAKSPEADGSISATCGPWRSGYEQLPPEGSQTHVSAAGPAAIASRHGVHSAETRLGECSRMSPDGSGSGCAVYRTWLVGADTLAARASVAQHFYVTGSSLVDSPARLD
jgi:hypothetical protein